jgi:hypothetical protein
MWSQRWWVRCQSGATGSFQTGRGGFLPGIADDALGIARQETVAIGQGLESQLLANGREYLRQSVLLDVVPSVRFELTLYGF